MALLDAPDIDSVVSANRAIATQLLSAADLWLFVTTAARYADAVPWDLLRTAADRGTAVAIVLDRIPPEAVDEIRPHLAAMLREQGLPTAPIFTVPRRRWTPTGGFPRRPSRGCASWLQRAGERRAGPVDRRRPDPAGRGGVALGAHGGARRGEPRPGTTPPSPLRKAVDESYDDARRRVSDGMTDGTLLRGEVLARWQEFVGTGEFFRQVETTISRWRDRVTAGHQGGPAPAEGLGEALQTGVAALLLSNAETAAPRRYAAGVACPAAARSSARHPDLAKPAPGLRPDVERLVRDWQGEVLELVRTEGQGRRTNARIAAYGLNAIGLFLMLVAFGSTGGLVGAEIGIAGGTAVLAQRVLEAIFGDQAVREMAAKARTRLLELAEAALRRGARAGMPRRWPTSPRRRTRRSVSRPPRPGCGRWCGEPAADGLRRGVPSCPPEQLAAAAASPRRRRGRRGRTAAGGRAATGPGAVVAKVEERTALVGGHTVVALAGATGSGKSSLFNALVGSPVATVGVRRPTTSTPTAAIWGDEPSASCSTGSASAPATTSRRGPRTAARSGRSTDSCCWTCPTSTPARSTTGWRPSGCSSSSTSSSGSPTRRSTPTPGCTTTTSRPWRPTKR